MKKIAIFLLTLSFVIQNTNAQSYEPQDKMGFILSAGYKHLSLKSSTHNALAFDISLHNHFNNIDFNSGFYWDKDYMSFDPFALFGIMCFYFVKYGEGGFLDGDNNVGLLICLLYTSPSPRDS